MKEDKNYKVVFSVKDTLALGKNCFRKYWNVCTLEKGSFLWGNLAVDILMDLPSLILRHCPFGKKNNKSVHCNHDIKGLLPDCLFRIQS